jgi:hypothetical protein
MNPIPTLHSKVSLSIADAPGHWLALRMALVAMALLIAGSGCDKLPIPGTETPAPAPTSAPAPKVVQPTPTPTPTPPVVVPQGPPPRTPDQIVAEFMKMPSQTRDDKAVLELASLDEAHRDQITEINANAAVGLSQVGLNAMKSFPNLQTVALNQIPLRGRTPMMEAIGQLTHLETLSLHKTAMVDDDLAALKPLQNLKHLILDDTDVSDKCFIYLKYLMKLERIDINGNLQIDGSGFAVFGDPKLKHPGIKVIHARKSRFGQKGFEAIYRSRSLEELHAPECYLSDAKLQGLSLCPNLRVVVLGFDQISDNGISLIKLAAKPKLEMFVVDNAKGITDASIKFFAPCKKLKTLQVTNTSMTPAGIEKLRKQMKNTNIVGP